MGLLTSLLNAVDYLDFNFFIEPKFSNNFNKKNFVGQNTINDSVRQINIFAGQILKKTTTDSSVVTFLDSVNCDFVCPTDFLFYPVLNDINFRFLTANIECDSVPILKETIIKTDSMRVGIFAIYSPDFVVKNAINPKAKFDFDIFQVAEKECEKLESQTDFIIMISNAGKFVDEDIVRYLPINVVVSFDYQKKNNELLSNKKTFFYSIISKRKKFGKLRLKYESGKIRRKWIEMNF